MALVTKAEIIANVFTRSVSESRIPQDYLEVVQYKYIRPILGEDFYDAVIADIAAYATLINTYLKPIIYWYAKYMILPELRYEISDLGTNQLQINNANPLTDEGFAAVRDQALIIAEEKVKILNDYLEDNLTLYPLYYKGLNASEGCALHGGIVMRTSENYDFYKREPND